MFFNFSYIFKISSARLSKMVLGEQGICSISDSHLHLCVSKDARLYCHPNATCIVQVIPIERFCNSSEKAKQKVIIMVNDNR